ncbi:MAG: peptide chain release factor aRF-1 [Halobacteria archaeon]|nr:peptide chain release factor aRF-1 [Halobacteria archaeon]
MKAKEYEKKKEFERLSEIKGGNTELVSLYISPGSNIADYRDRIRTEISEADNIKSKETRQNVKSALQSILDVLGNYRQTPENGLVIFSSKDETYVFDDLETPIDSSRYHCDSEFLIEPLETSLDSSTTYGLVIITENEASIGVLEGNTVRERKHMESNLHGKHKAGGQSAQRFARDRREKKKRFFKKVGQSAGKILDSEEIDGVIVGGTEITRKDFLDGGYLHHELEKMIIGRFAVSYAGESGLRQLADAADEVISEQRINEEKELIERFYSDLREGKNAYGVDRVEDLVEHGRVETLLISEDVEGERYEELAEKADEMGGETEYISTDFDKGEQFYQSFGGVGAILRW